MGGRAVGGLGDRQPPGPAAVADGRAPAAVELSLGSEIGRGGWDLGSYALFLVCGYLVAADPRIGQALERHWRPAAAWSWPTPS